MRVVNALLDKLKQLLKEAHKLSESKGGRPKDDVRTMAVAALAQGFSEIVGKPSGARGGPYAEFCNDVFSAIGWASAGESIEHTLPAAIRIWKGRSRLRQLVE